jgi:scyllo-inositol 2-dehydrogenase (NADP+)
MLPIPVALVGYGYGGLVFHAPFIRSVPRLRLEMVVTSRREQVDALAGPDGTPRAVARVEEALADPRIRLVVVATPTDTHFAVARQALLAGKHVVVDKPFALTVAEAEELMALARERGCLLSVYHNRRWDGDFLTVRHAIEQGWLGTVYHYEAHIDRFRPKVREVWREQAGKGSGILYDLGSHLIDQALVLFGMPRAVTADAFLQRPEARAIDYFHLILDYGRMRAILHGAMLVPGRGPHFSVHGDGGSFLKYGMDPQEAALAAGQMPGGEGWGADDSANYGELVSADGARRRIETLAGDYTSYYQAMADAIERGSPLPVDPADSRDGLRVIEAALESAREGRTVTLP